MEKRAGLFLAASLISAGLVVLTDASSVARGQTRTDTARPDVVLPAGERPWNILILVADDMGVDLIGVYGVGSGLPRTPNIDALARSGVLFREAWTNPLCSPTRATIQTGRYSFRTGIGWLVGGTGPALGEQEVTLAELVASAPVPYATGAFGKWHLGNSTVGGPLAPNRAGYRQFEGTSGNLGSQPQAYFRWLKITNGQTKTSKRYATTETVNSAAKWIRSSPEPWLAYVAFHANHRPIHAPPAHLHSVTLPQAGPKDSPRPYARAMVEAMDSEIGRLLEGLDPGVRSRTVTIFVADNGTGGRITRSPFRKPHAKPSLYQGGIHVPLIVSGGVVKEPGRESSALVNSTDLYATVAELAGLDPRSLAPKRTLDSVSLVAQLKEPGSPPGRRFAFAEKFFPNGWPPQVWGQAIRNDRYKLMRTSGSVPPSLKERWSPSMRSREELYDLKSDPFEQANLLAGGELTDLARRNYDELAAELRRLLGNRSVQRP